MKDQISTDLGFNIATSIAGLFGALVSLAFSQGLTRVQASMALAVGLFTANYLTPIVMAKLGISPELQNGTAFIIGLCSMSLIPGIKKYVASRAGRLGVLAAPPTQGDGGTK